MRKLTFTLTLVLLTIVSMNAQTTVIDFEDLPYEQGGWNGTGEVVSNTINDGINTSANACMYTIPADAAWGNCAWVVFEDAIIYKAVDSIQLMVLAPSATQMYVKLENNEATDEKQPEAYATPVESSEWQLVTLHFSGISGEDSINAKFDKFAFFFNVNDANGGEEWYYDNVMVYYKEGSLPPMANAGDDQTVKEGDEVMLSAAASNGNGAELTYQWESLSTEISLDDPTAVSPTFTAPQVDVDTKFEFVLTVNNGTVDSEPDTVVVTVQNTVSVNTNQVLNASVYPNPATDYITIIGDGQVAEIYDITGALITTIKQLSEMQQLFIGDFSKGIYLIKITNELNQVRTVKITKQ